MPFVAHWIIAAVPTFAGPPGAVASPQVAPASPQVSPPAPQAPQYEPPARPVPQTEADTGRERQPISKQIHDDWLLSLEAATHLPTDVGFQAGVEMPFGLRLFGGYGWVPTAFVNWAAGTAGSDRVTRAILETADYSGHLGRVTLGLRPFRSFGGYLDAGYAHASLSGSQGIPAVSYAGTTLFQGGTYNARSDIDLWLVELGYQAELAGRLVLAGGLGLTGALGARTSITPSAGAPSDPALGRASATVDHELRTHVMPTLTLRLGFDLI
jgi:hypothetical protein